MSFLNISTLPGVLCWILLVLLLVKIAEIVADREERLRELASRVKKLEEENEKLYTVINQHRSSLVCLKYELQRNSQEA